VSCRASTGVGDWGRWVNWCGENAIDTKCFKGSFWVPVNGAVGEGKCSLVAFVGSSDGFDGDGGRGTVGSSSHVAALCSIINNDDSNDVMKLLLLLESLDSSPGLSIPKKGGGGNIMSDTTPPPQLPKTLSSIQA
jgi:hypothetical protein